MTINDDMIEDFYASICDYIDSVYESYEIDDEKAENLKEQIKELIIEIFS